MLTLVLLWMQLERSSEDASSLRIDDEVEFTLVTDLKTDSSYVRNLRLLCRAANRRELGQVPLAPSSFFQSETAVLRRLIACVSYKWGASTCCVPGCKVSD